MDKQPQTLLEAVAYFSDPEVAHRHFVAIRWPHGMACPRMGCGSADVLTLGSRNRFRCKECKRDFTAKVGTIFEDSALPLTKWLPCVWLIANAKNGISSCEVSRALGVTQKTAWFMLHRVRVAFNLGSDAPLSGMVEADETYVGGLVKNMHPRKRLNSRPGVHDKVPVMGMIERKGRVRAFVVPSIGAQTLQGNIRKHVAKGSTLYTDGAPAYRGLSNEYAHYVIDHAYEYVRGHVHTNSIENFWALLKRSIKGTYIRPDGQHLDAYIAEQVFRFNERGTNDGARFRTAAKAVDGKRLTYAELIAKNPNRPRRRKATR
jgi:transposase-like protein